MSPVSDEKHNQKLSWHYRSNCIHGLWFNWTCSIPSPFKSGTVTRSACSSQQNYLLPFLNTGTTLASFQSKGRKPILRDVLNSWHKDGAIQSHVLSPLWKLASTSKTSVTVRVRSNNVRSTLSPASSLSVELQLTGSDVNTDTKYRLNSSMISAGDDAWILLPSSAGSQVGSVAMEITTPMFWFQFECRSKTFWIAL